MISPGLTKTAAFNRCDLLWQNFTPLIKNGDAAIPHSFRTPVIGSVQRRHPYLSCTKGQCCLHCRQVKPSNGVVQDQPTKDTDPAPN